MTQREVVFDRLPLSERSWVLSALRQETVGGSLLLGAAVTALLWANSPWRSTYRTLTEVSVGPEALHLHLSLAAWAADGLLAVFFFVAGLELKHELVLGTLSKASRAIVPVVAALAGMVVPALLYVATVSAMGDAEAVRGWGIPMATDIAFALAVLAVVGSKLPVALRAFLLTLAVVDDLGAILVIAIFYGHGFSVTPFVLAATGIGIWWVLQRLGASTWLVFLPLALVVWGLMHASGVHATVAGVALGLLTRVRRKEGLPQTATSTCSAPCPRGCVSRCSRSSRPASPSSGWTPLLCPPPSPWESWWAWYSVNRSASTAGLAWSHDLRAPHCPPRFGGPTCSPSRCSPVSDSRSRC